MKRFIVLICISYMVTMHLFAQTQVIAHRGFWKTEGSAQNSLTALIKADSINCYGSEFDVWLTKNNQLIVNHDSFFKGKKMESSKASTLTSLKLTNNENMPTLENYFETAKSLKTNLILELKAHSKPKKETQAVTQIIELVKQYDLSERIEYISFSLHAIKEFIKYAPNAKVYYLNGELSPKELKEIGCTGLDYSLKTIKKHPEWIKEAQELGLKVNVWTVNKEEDMKWLIQEKVDFITTDEPLLLQSLLK